MNSIGMGAGVLLLATFVEGTVEYLFGRYASVKPYLQYIALALGMGVCVAYSIDIFATLGLTSGIPFVGEILSGIIVGRGSNYMNDMMTSFDKPIVLDAPSPK